MLVFGAGLLAGAMNAAAGGGSFVTLPALVYAGVPAVSANMASTVALFPGAFASVYAYRDDFRDLNGVSVRTLLPVSLAGGIAGAVLLLVTPSRAFDSIIPWILLLGVVAFAFGRQIGEWLSRYVTLGLRGLLIMQFVIAIYGGYFGGAVGLMMLAMWSLFGVHDLRATAGLRSLLVGSLNACAVALFAWVGTVFWPQALTMLIGGVIGGYAGARIARKVDQRKLRIFVIALNSAITAAFFWRVYG